MLGSREIGVLCGFGLSCPSICMGIWAVLRSLLLQILHSPFWFFSSCCELRSWCLSVFMTFLTKKYVKFYRTDAKRLLHCYCFIPQCLRLLSVPLQKLCEPTSSAQQKNHCSKLLSVLRNLLERRMEQFHSMLKFLFCTV